MISLTGKSWKIASRTPQSSLLEHFLKLRGVADQPDFLTPSLSQLHDPRELKDAEKAVKRIEQAIRKQERILIIGDYDVDGVVGAAILFRALQTIKAVVSVRLPDRMRDGYGLNKKMVEEAREKDVKLIITVDNGISAVPAVARANELGIDVIITDHHLPPSELPAAFAIVNPRQDDCLYPFDQLSGSTVAWKLALILLDSAVIVGEAKQSPDSRDRHDPPSGSRDDIRDELLGFAAIGTIADVCPLITENRIIVYQGLQALKNTKNPGLARLFQSCEITGTPTAEDIGYRIGPRINAAGRLDSALTAFQALTHPTHAEQFANELEELNKRRQQVGERILNDVTERLGEIGSEEILIGSSPDWHRGIIGLTAGKLAEQFYRPVILMEENTKKGEFIGSCRCPIAAFNITVALQEVSELLTVFGGHCAAAGFTLPAKHRAEFEKRLREIAKEQLAKIELTPTLRIDAELVEAEITLETLAELQQLAPFGAGNPEPTFLVKDVPISGLKTVGSDDKHLSLKVGQNKIKAIGFGLGEYLAELSKNATADLVVTLSEDHWKGRQAVQVKVVDIN